MRQRGCVLFPQARRKGAPWVSWEGRLKEVKVYADGWEAALPGTCRLRAASQRPCTGLEQAARVAAGHGPKAGRSPSSV